MFKPAGASQEKARFSEREFELYRRVIERIRTTVRVTWSVALRVCAEGAARRVRNFPEAAIPASLSWPWRR
jgi:hypothetical protein